MPRPADPLGTLSAMALLAVVVALNFLAIRWVIYINSVATWWKLLVPVATIFILLAYSFHPGNMTSQLDSTPVSGIFTAVGTAGIIFSFLGFQQAIALAGETRNPSKYVPIALIGSVVIALIIYLGLQFAFIVALQPADIDQGWTHLHFAGMFGPLAAILIAVGAFWWAWVLYFDAVVSPLGTAFIYITGSPRILMAAGEMGGAPSSVAKLNRFGVPWIALVGDLRRRCGILLPLPFLVEAGVGGVLHHRAVLRHRPGDPAAPAQHPAGRGAPVPPQGCRDRLAHRLHRLQLDHLLDRQLRDERAVRAGGRLRDLPAGMAPAGEASARFHAGWQQAWWLLPYFIGMWLISYFGPSASGMGGNDSFSFFTGMLLVAVFSPFMLLLA